MVPDDAQVEITAKVFHGYNAGKAYQGIDADKLKETKGREYWRSDSDDTIELEHTGLAKTIKVHVSNKSIPKESYN